MNDIYHLIGFSNGSWGFALAKAALVTMEISIGAFIVGISLGLFTALIKLYGNPYLRRIAESYTTLFRAVPELLLILLFFYGGSALINSAYIYMGFGTVDVAGLPVAIIVLGLVQGAYASEIFRGAIQSVDQGQTEAALAYGMSNVRLFLHVTLPLMAPNALAGLSNLWVNLIKDSALISVIGTNELIYTAKQAGGSTHNYLVFFITVAAIYYVITLISSYLLRQLEIYLRRWQPKQ